MKETPTMVKATGLRIAASEKVKTTRGGKKRGR
jgi:hypothetical protein